MVPEIFFRDPNDRPAIHRKCMGPHTSKMYGRKNPIHFRCMGYWSLGSRNFIFRDHEKFPYDNPRISKTQNFLKSSGYHRENSHGPGDFFSRPERSTGHTSKMYGAPYIENVWGLIHQKCMGPHTFLMYGVLVSRVTKFYFSGTVKNFPMITRGFQKVLCF